MIPPKLKAGDHVRVIAPAHGFSPSFTDDMKERAEKKLGELGLTVSYGKYVWERNEFDTTSIEKRLEDLHDAYADPKVSCIIPAMGGSSANQLLKYIDYELVEKKPKIICGLSDITALADALYKKTGVVTYYGPHFTMLGASKIVDYSIEHIRKTFFSEASFSLKPSEHYCDSEWDKQKIVNEDGFWPVNQGEAEGKSIGGNLLTINFLLGSEFMPDMKNTILFLEANKVLDYKDVQNTLQAILNQPASDQVLGIIIGRFQKKTGMTRDLFEKMIRSKNELNNIPVVGNVDFGHTIPMLTFPIGGKVKMKVTENNASVEVTEH
ncbi:S66 peptidase family protein [Cesiribacter sp. SM1]|uniref:S66 family peptidase n=1 Tax=Cesiribacter sp. SM1 TaxID=2861196 RepID=UPI001CD2933E|nr:S66 peptidase family protein [Cesiribacter sp. SM1]